MRRAEATGLGLFDPPGRRRYRAADGWSLDSCPEGPADLSLFGSIPRDEDEALAIEVEQAWPQPRPDALANVVGHPHAIAVDLVIPGHARGVGEQVVRSNRRIRWIVRLDLDLAADQAEIVPGRQMPAVVGFLPRDLLGGAFGQFRQVGHGSTGFLVKDQGHRYARSRAGSRKRRCHASAAPCRLDKDTGTFRIVRCRASGASIIPATAAIPSRSRNIGRRESTARRSLASARYD